MSGLSSSVLRALMFDAHETPRFYNVRPCSSSRLHRVSHLLHFLTQQGFQIRSLLHRYVSQYQMLNTRVVTQI